MEFGRDSERQTVKETDFLNRSSTFKPEILESLYTVKRNSLHHLWNAIFFQFKTSIFKQALHECFNVNAVSFLKQGYGQLASRQAGISSF
ncbi:hypothetical protein [Halobacillus seohaensis]|uniref:hypothetical protein n=1 Tax=Halobacillus seohaensis TaxID=447421 RepID=UPI0036F2C56D